MCGTMRTGRAFSPTAPARTSPAARLAGTSSRSPGHDQGARLAPAARATSAGGAEPRAVVVAPFHLHGASRRGGERSEAPPALPATSVPGQALEAPRSHRLRALSRPRDRRSAIAAPRARCCQRSCAADPGTGSESISTPRIIWRAAASRSGVSRRTAFSALSQFVIVQPDDRRGRAVGLRPSGGGSPRRKRRARSEGAACRAAPATDAAPGWPDA